MAGNMTQVVEYLPCKVAQPSHFPLPKTEILYILYPVPSNGNILQNTTLLLILILHIQLIWISSFTCFHLHVCLCVFRSISSHHIYPITYSTVVSSQGSLVLPFIKIAFSFLFASYL
jgi:hypothetical protein